MFILKRIKNAVKESGQLNLSLRQILQHFIKELVKN